MRCVGEGSINEDISICENIKNKGAVVTFRTRHPATWIKDE